MKKIQMAMMLAMILVSTQVFAKQFSTQFMEFQLPNGWDCALEGSEWVCQSDNKDRKREAIIILAAKSRNENDTLEQYQAHLKAPKSFQLPGGKTQISEPKSVKITDVNNQKWVDSLHLASEVPGFYTRYLATVKDTLGVAITFSVGKDYYDAYKDIFDKIVATLKVFDQKAGQGANWKPKNKEENLLSDGTYIPNMGGNQDISVQKKKEAGGAGGDDTMLYILLAVAVVAFILFKLKKKKGGAKKSGSKKK